MNDTVDRNSFACLDYKNIAFFDFIGVKVNCFSVLYNVSSVGADVHKTADGVTGTVYRKVAEPFAELI